MPYKGQNVGWDPTDNGLLAATMDPVNANGGLALTSGYIVLEKIKLPFSMTLANIWTALSAAGSGFTSAKMGLYLPSGALIASTADQSANWTSGGTKKMALTVVGGQSLTQSGWLWVAWLVVATGVPSVAAAVGSAGAAGGNTGYINTGNVYSTSVPGAQHRHGYESAAGRTSLISLNGLTITDASQGGVSCFAALS